MACSHPIPAVDYGYKVNKDGKTVRNIKLVDLHHKYFGYGLEELKQHFGDSLLLLPCGHCYLCSLDYSRMWASRIMLEAQQHKDNCFITLTYHDCFLPDKPVKRHWQLFVKRLRKYCGCQIRYFACGEKGDKTGRSHMHAIIFGFDFPDKEELKRSGSGLMIYRSKILEELWPYGISSIGSVSPESSQYVAKYAMKKKLTGEDSGEWVLMSRRPGIGINGYDVSDYDTDKLYIHGKTFKMPRYFDKITEKLHPDVNWFIKSHRVETAKNFKSKKYQWNLKREEHALEKEEAEKIRVDSLKVRLGV